MIFDLVEIVDQKQKSEICLKILKALPEWFGNEAAVVDYAKQSRDLPFLSVYADGEAVGFVALKNHNAYTAEVCVIGVMPEYHRKGAGEKLIRWCESYCENKGKEFLTVKTLDESADSESYGKTRKFYHSVGFRPLEVFPLFWDKDNPCLMLAKHIDARHIAPK